MRFLGMVRILCFTLATIILVGSVVGCSSSKSKQNKLATKNNSASNNATTKTTSFESEYIEEPIGTIVTETIEPNTLGDDEKPEFNINNNCSNGGFVFKTQNYLYYTCPVEKWKAPVYRISSSGVKEKVTDRSISMMMVKNNYIYGIDYFYEGEYSGAKKPLIVCNLTTKKVTTLARDVMEIRYTNKRIYYSEKVEDKQSDNVTAIFSMNYEGKDFREELRVADMGSWTLGSEKVLDTRPYSYKYISVINIYYCINSKANSVRQNSINAVYKKVFYKNSDSVFIYAGYLNNLMSGYTSSIDIVGTDEDGNLIFISKVSAWREGGKCIAYNFYEAAGTWMYCGKETGIFNGDKLEIFNGGIVIIDKFIYYKTKIDGGDTVIYEVDKNNDENNKRRIA